MADRVFGALSLVLSLSAPAHVTNFVLMTLWSPRTSLIHHTCHSLVSFTPTVLPPCLERLIHRFNRHRNPNRLLLMSRCAVWGFTFSLCFLPCQDPASSQYFPSLLAPLSKSTCGLALGNLGHSYPMSGEQFSAIINSSFWTRCSVCCGCFKLPS